jgi:hypothetical protein
MLATTLRDIGRALITPVQQVAVRQVKAEKTSYADAIERLQKLESQRNVTQKIIYNSVYTVMQTDRDTDFTVTAGKLNLGPSVLWSRIQTVPVISVGDSPFLTPSEWRARTDPSYATSLVKALLHQTPTGRLVTIQETIPRKLQIPIGLGVSPVSIGVWDGFADLVDLESAWAAAGSKGTWGFVRAESLETLTINESSNYDDNFSALESSTVEPEIRFLADGVESSIQEVRDKAALAYSVSQTIATAVLGTALSIIPGDNDLGGVITGAVNFAVDWATPEIHESIAVTEANWTANTLNAKSCVSTDRVISSVTQYGVSSSRFVETLPPGYVVTSTSVSNDEGYEIVLPGAPKPTLFVLVPGDPIVVRIATNNYVQSGYVAFDDSMIKPRISEAGASPDHIEYVYSMNVPVAAVKVVGGADPLDWDLIAIGDVAIAQLDTTFSSKVAILTSHLY